MEGIQVEDRERRRPGDRMAKLFERWQRLELPAGLVLVGLGFVVIGLGWLDASGTPDVRRQMQALISGGFGGLGLLLLGSTLLVAQVTSRSTKRMESRLDRVADALLELASLEAPAAGDGTIQIPLGEVAATHASFHDPDCDLVSGRDNVRLIPPGQAEEEGLRPCRVCLHA